MKKNGCIVWLACCCGCGGGRGGATVHKAMSLAGRKGASFKYKEFSDTLIVVMDST